MDLLLTQPSFGVSEWKQQMATSCSVCKLQIMSIVVLLCYSGSLFCCFSATTEHFL